MSLHGMTFDTLSYARRLKQAGLPEAQAEAIAEGTRELVMQDVATKSDLTAVRAEISAMEQRLAALIETQGLRLTVRLGGLIAIGVAVLAAIIKL